MVDRKMQVVVLGAGSIGSLIGGWLARGQLANVALVGRDPHIETVNDRGLTVEFLNGTEIVKVRGYTHMRDVPFKPDLVVLTVRAYQTDQALRELVDSVGQVPVITFQNGYLEENIARAVTEEYTLGGTTVMNAKLIAPGHVCQNNSVPFVIGELSGESTTRIQAIRDAFVDAGMDCRISSNIRGEIWGKMTVNANSNTITGATNLTVREMYEVEHTRRFSYGLARESFMVAEAAGINLDDISDPLARELQEAVKSPKCWDEFAQGKARTMRDFKLSMCALLERGVPTEVDYTNGFIAAKAREFWTRAPHHEAITKIIHEIEAGSRESNPDNLQGSFALV